MVLTAYVDESMRRRRGEGACFYVLAAVLVDDSDLDDVRAVLRGLRYGKSRELHWRDERPERRPLIAEAVAGLPVAAVVAVCIHGPSVPSERARRLSLGRLLHELSVEGVNQAVFDSRRDQDRSELRLIQNWRRFGRPGCDVRTDFFVSASEPALWAADCAAGAVAWWLNGDAVGWQHLEAVTRVVDVDP
ncbi:hypothetical protein ABH920_000916 [Catenulispora sp. EB89]|uniref:hypothetical protein n=1 Tax=Catenulispora sp. EB89 TaxID=3156257 RepID=UPI00351316D8